mgnify:CR=1 FL=1
MTLYVRLMANLDRLRELRATNRASPFYPGVFFFTALKGKSSTGVSLLSGLMAQQSGDDAHRRWVRQAFKNPPSSKEQVRKMIGSKPFAKLVALPAFSQFLPRGLRDLLSFRHDFRSSEAIFVDAFVNALPAGDKVVEAIRGYNDTLIQFERVFFKERSQFGLDRIQEYFMLPDELVNRLDVPESQIDHEFAKSALILMELIKVQNIYCDLRSRIRLDLPEFEYLEKSDAGAYTTYFFDRLLENSEIANWAELSRKLEEKVKITIQVRELRAYRSAVNCLPVNKLEKMLDVLNADPLAMSAYYVAFCCDKHFETLQTDMRCLIDKESAKMRLSTAEKRWNECVLPILSKSPPP